MTMKKKKKKKAHHERTVINECTLKKVTRVKLAHIMIQCFCVSRCFHLTRRRKKKKKATNTLSACQHGICIHAYMKAGFTQRPTKKKKKKAMRTKAALISRLNMHSILKKHLLAQQRVKRRLRMNNTLWRLIKHRRIGACVGYIKCEETARCFRGLPTVTHP